MSCTYFEVDPSIRTCKSNPCITCRDTNLNVVVKDKCTACISNPCITCRDTNLNVVVKDKCTACISCRACGLKRSDFISNISVHPYLFIHQGVTINHDKTYNKSKYCKKYF
jgi:hypothetical protein